MASRLYACCATMALALQFYPSQGFADSAIWRYLTSLGAPVGDIAIDPANPETVYTVDGIVSQSTDGGASWAPIFNPRERGLVFLACPRKEPGVVYAWGHMQAFKSTNFGKSWTLIVDGPFVGSLESFAVADAAPQKLYVIIRLSQRELRRSDDGGTTWVQIPIDISVLGDKLAVSKADPDTVYLTASEPTHIWRSRDSGETWRTFEVPINRQPYVWGIATHPTHRDFVYLFFADAIASSFDGGEMWHIFRLPDQGSWLKPDVWLSPSQPTVLYAGTRISDAFTKEENPYAATSAGIYCTPLYETAPGFQPYLYPTSDAPQLFQNYPNPSHGKTYFPYRLSQISRVAIDIHDMSGHLVQSIKLGVQDEGPYLLPNRAAHWDGRNTDGESVADGIYFYTLKVNKQPVDTRRMAVTQR